MYLQDYIWFMVALLVCIVFSAIASGKVHSSFAKYRGVRCRSQMTGYDTVTRLMRVNGIRDIAVGRVAGELTDHYHPSKKIVNLSESTYDSDSVAAVAVAAHEMGHVMQKQNGYALYRLRTALVLVGLLLDLFVKLANSQAGFYIAMVGVCLYGGSLLFALVTLPVELNASKRAKEMLLAEGILSEAEIPAAKEVLSAAALTYFASLLTSLVYFLRFLVYVLTIFGRRNGRRR